MMAAMASAPSTRAQNWNNVNWNIIRASVFHMQQRIAQSIRQNKWGAQVVETGTSLENMGVDIETLFPALKRSC
jgi:hypothetical protein